MQYTQSQARMYTPCMPPSPPTKIIAVCPLANRSKNGQINKNKNYTSHNHANATFVDAASEAPPKAKTCIRMTVKEIIPPGREIRVDYDKGSTQKQFYNQMIKKGIPREQPTSAEYRKSKTWDTAEARKHATEPEPRGTSTRPGKSAADLRCRQREEVGDGTCPSSLCNSASLIPTTRLRLRGGAPDEVRCPRNCPQGAKQGGGQVTERTAWS